MKTFFLIPTLSALIVSLFAFGQSANKKNLTDLEKMGIKGNVKSLRKTTYKAIDNLGEIKKQMSNDTSFTFDRKGNKILEQWYYEFKGEIKPDSKKISHKYDTAGNPIEWTISTTEGKILTKVINKYGNRGNIIEKTIYDNDALYNEAVVRKKFFFKYDDKGNQIEGNCYDKDGNSIEKTTSKYDQNGNEIEFCSSGLKLICKYENNKKVEVKKYNNDLLNQTVTYEYDDKGNTIEESAVASNGDLIHKLIYKYDNNNNQIEGAMYQQGFFQIDFVGKFTSKYDERNNLIEKAVYNKDDTVKDKLTRKYEYDAKNNWTKMTEYKNQIIQAIVERKFEY